MVREAVGLFDQSSFSKFLVQGRDAERALNRICANNVAVPIGKCVYTRWLNERGTIEADLTVTRLESGSFMVVTAPATHTHVHTWLKRNIPIDDHVVVTDVTSGLMCLNIQGPKPRMLLEQVCKHDFSDDSFPFGTLQEVEIGYATVKALRLTYMGELGWELYIDTEFTPHVYDRLVAAGGEQGLQHCGYHTLQSLRMEKAYREFGHTLGGAVALGYVNHPGGVDAAFIKGGRYQIEVAGRRYPATASLQPMYDPKSERVRS